MNLLMFLSCTAALLLLGSYPLVSNLEAIPDEEAVCVSSELADYHGEKILLEGNVVIEHPRGTISANHITLHISKKNEIEPFGLLQMHDCVKLAFKDGEQLSCGKAELDYQNLMGHFFGNESQEFVIYTENDVDTKAGKAATAPLIVKSRYMSIRLSSKNIKGDKKLPKNNINVLTADEQVAVNYNHDFIVAADHAVYQRMPEVSKEAKGVALPGVLTMTASKEGGTCQVSNREGDMIRASQISIDTVKRQLTFTCPKGTLKAKKIDFSARTLVWDDLAGILSLSGQVELNQYGMGKLETPQEVRFYQHVINQKKALKSIETLSDTVLTYREEDKNLFHTLTCSGPVKVDHEKMETRLFGKQNSEGNVTEEQQVHFKDAKGEIFADKVLVKYALLDGSPIINKIFLVGNVKIYNRLSSTDDDTAVVLQYVLADRVDFTPHTNEMFFKSFNAGRRVLFFDKSNHLQVSAPALKMIRDKATGKDSIKGIGDVRFSFLDSEFEQLRKRFLLSSDHPT